MRLVIVSNRLPVTAAQANDKLLFEKSVGGLASGLSSYLDSVKDKLDYIWVGWPGSDIAPSRQRELKSIAASKYKAYPVFLSKEDMDKFYLGFCNKTIWALFHFFPAYVAYDEGYWKHYRQVNETFSAAVSEIVKPGDVLWIHDYHLMLLPRLLRKQLPDTPIGFFLHIPFPSFEIFRLLPRRWRSEILEGLLGADLVGFHTHDYSQYFLRCVHRILGYEHNMGEVQAGDRIVKVDTFPMGIDFKKFQEGATNAKVKLRKEELRKRFQNLKVVLSIDRLDYSKGILNRLRGYELFLEMNPRQLGKVILLLIVVPSRIGVERYQTMKRQIDEIVGRINGRFARVAWTPIMYQYRSLSFFKLRALYGVSDIILVTPLRDGMNLIAKEYVASRIDKTGVLVLSEMAGAAKEMGEAIIINPNTIEEIAEALEEALKMPHGEQKRRNEIMQDRLRRYDVTRWATDFLQSLEKFKDHQRNQEARILSPTIRTHLLDSLSKAKKKLFLLDYDGTLIPFATHPQLAAPSHDLMNLLQHFSEDSSTYLILISGRDKQSLQNWFGKMKIGMIAEHGVSTREKNQEWKTIKPLSNNWKAQIRPIFEVYADRLPGAFVEEKEFSLVFHFRQADPELANLRTRELEDNLLHLTANLDVQVLKGSKVIEMRTAGVNKGTAGMHFLSKSDFDFILAIGDDWTDEDLFRVLPDNAYSIKVGVTPSYAKYSLRNSSEVLDLLKDMARIV